MNLSLFSGNEEYTKKLVETVIQEKVKIVFTAAGNPATYTKKFQENGMSVVHVVANLKGAKKCQEVGCDAIVGEGIEAGGHLGREETTTLVLIPYLKKNIKIPIIAAGGIGTGRGMLASMVLGAEGVQIGTRFIATEESSAHESFKKKILTLKDGDTLIALKKSIPSRMIKNKLYKKVSEMEDKKINAKEINKYLRGKTKLGMFEGNIDDGEILVGQISALIRKIMPAKDIVEEIIAEFEAGKKEMNLLNF